MFRLSGSVPPVAGPYPEEILRKTIDDQHRRWRWIYAFVFIMVGGLAATITGLVLFLGGHPPARTGPMIAVLVVDIAAFAIAAAFQVCFGPGFLRGAYRRALNDEFTRALQHSAAMFGYLLSVVLMCAILAAVALRPQWGLVILPGAIAAVVILPGLYVLVRQWRAASDD
jgi:hypothetical protein